MKSRAAHSSAGISYETALWGDGHQTIAGLDEAGRGAWAGPVCAAAVILPSDKKVSRLLHGVNDSKKLTVKQRERWVDCIKSVSVTWAVAFSSQQEIDEEGIVPATCIAMNRALLKLKYEPTHLLIDYLRLPNCAFPQTSIPKGDSLSLSIAAASILAKTSRDELMRLYGKEYPKYGFEQHKGYGTRKHRQSLYEHGLTTLHRKSFMPMKTME